MASFSFNSVPDSISVVQLFICVSQSIPAFPVQNCQCNESCAPADVVTAASAMLPISARINIEKTLRAGESTATLTAYRNVLQVPCSQISTQPPTFGWRKFINLDSESVRSVDAKSSSII